VQALGLKKINDTKIHKDNPAIRGMVGIVAHLVKVEKVADK
jgi:large subunit ribosomal protein L30